MVARSVSSRLFTAVTVGLTAAISIFAQQPPPPPPPPAGGPHPLRGLTPGELASFQEGIKRFNEVDSVTEPPTLYRPSFIRTVRYAWFGS
jgi:hypothetical protein